MTDSHAFAHWQSLVAWWQARRLEHNTVGRKLAPRKPIEPGADPTMGSTSNTEPPPVPTLQQAKARMADDATRGMGSPPDDTPDEGGEVLGSDVAALARRYEQLTPAAKAWTSELVSQGNQGHPWRIKGAPTVRRFELYRGVLALAEWGDGQPLLNDIVRAICGDHTDTPTGVLLGELDADQAADFAHKAIQVSIDRLVPTYGDDGTPTLQPVA